MGAWGTAIFSDDTASDVRDEFRDLIGEGLSTEQATDKLLREYAPSLDDPDDGPPFFAGPSRHAVEKRAAARAGEGKSAAHYRYRRGPQALVGRS